MEFDFDPASLGSSAPAPLPDAALPPAPPEHTFQATPPAPYASPGRVQRALRRATQARISTPQLLERKRRRADQAATLRDTGQAGGAAVAEANPHEGDGAGLEKVEANARVAEIVAGAWPTDLQLRSSVSFRSPLPFGWLERSGAVEAFGKEREGHSARWRTVGAAGSLVHSLSFAGVGGSGSDAIYVAERAGPLGFVDHAAASSSVSPTTDSARVASDSANTDMQATATLLSTTSYFAYPSNQWPAAMLAATSSATERLFQSVASKLREWEAENRTTSKVGGESGVDGSVVKRGRVGRPSTPSHAPAAESRGPAPAAKARGGSGRHSVVSFALAAADRASWAADAASAVLAARQQRPPTLISLTAERSAAAAAQTSREALEAAEAAKVALEAAALLSKQASGRGGEHLSGGGLSSSDVARLHVLLDRAERTVASASLAARVAADAAHTAANNAKSDARAAETEYKADSSAETVQDAGSARVMASSEFKQASSSSSSSSLSAYAGQIEHRSQQPTTSVLSSSAHLLPTFSSHTTVTRRSLLIEGVAMKADPSQQPVSSNLHAAHFSSFPTLAIPALPEWMTCSSFTSDAVLPSFKAVAFSSSIEPKAAASFPAAFRHLFSEPASTADASTIPSSMLPPPPKHRVLGSRGESTYASTSVPTTSSTTLSNGERKPLKPQPHVIHPEPQPRICELPREAYTSIVPLLQAVSKRGEVEMVSMWLDRVYRFQEALASAWATLLVSSTQNNCRLPSQSDAESARHGPQSSSGHIDENSLHEMHFLPSMPFFLLRFGPAVSTGNVIIFGLASALLNCPDAVLGPDVAGHQPPADRKRTSFAQGNDIVAIIARSSPILRLLLSSAGVRFSTPLDPTLRQHDLRSAGTSAAELEELARYEQSVSTASAGTIGVAKEILGILTMTRGHDSSKAKSAPSMESGDDKDAGTRLDHFSPSEHKHVTDLPLLSSASPENSLRGSEDSQGSLLLVSGADQCRLLAQLLLESVSPGSLSPPPLLSSLSAQQLESGRSHSSLAPPRSRLPLACISLIGCGGQNSQARNRASDAAINLDVPQILAFGLGISAAPPFRNACACALDLRLREVSELSSKSATEPADTSAIPQRQFELEVRGPILPHVLPQLAILVSAMQARESCRLTQTHVRDEQALGKGNSNLLVKISSTTHLAMQAFAGSSDAGS